MRLFLATPFWLVAFVCGFISELSGFIYFSITRGWAYASERQERRASHD